MNRLLSQVQIFRVARTCTFLPAFLAKNGLKVASRFGLPSSRIGLIRSINPQQSATESIRFLTVETVEHQAARCPVHGVFVFLPEVPFVGEGWRRCSVCGWRAEAKSTH